MASIFFKYAAMNAGKSTQLIQAAFNYTERGMKPLVLKPSIDTRSKATEVSARVGIACPCTSFTKSESIIDVVLDNTEDFTRIDVVLIDEAQFMSEEQVVQLIFIAKCLKIPVVCYGLKNDFSGNLFEGSAKLLAIADKFEELKTVCWCGSKATQNARVNSEGEMVLEGETVEVGDVGRYVPLCLEHFYLKAPYPTSKGSWENLY